MGERTNAVHLWAARAGALGAAVMALSLACATAAPAQTPTAAPPSPTATATPTATPEPAPTSTPTASPTPRLPTATAPAIAPAATVVPPPGSTGPRIAALQVTVAPARLPQGGAFALRVEAGEPLAWVRVVLDGRSLPVQLEGATAWAVGGFRSDVPLGSRVLSVTASTAGGAALQGEGAVTVVAGGFPVERITIEPGDGGGDLLEPGVLNEEWNRLLALTRVATPERRWEGPFMLPVAGPVTSQYGTRRSYNGGPPGSPHEGTDFGVDPGTPVIAANTGVVVVAAPWKVRGNAVIIDHGLGLFSGYYHLSDLAVQPGQAVRQAQILGRSGATGLATGPHLHWEVVLQGQHTQPLQWTQRAFP